MKNELDQETSPYLLQHQDNPVHWQPWGPKALKMAKKQGKPILLSVGYAACHWCHVMAHESFENDQVAAVMNDLFINIKVDREERPDIDQIYQTSLSLLGEQGGWPLTMFLTSDGDPFWGGTYFPKEPAYGRAGFGDVLTSIRGIFDNEPEKVTKNREALKTALKQHNSGFNGDRPRLSLEVLDRIADRYAEELDHDHGGIGSAPKFPQTYVLENLWRAYLRNGKASLADGVTQALTAMSQGGIYDHLGGGYSRYSTDRFWLAPHFEKMLYDNALILHLMGLVYAENKNPLFEQRIKQTIGWINREMITEGGAFSATLDADSEGVEGKFYVWDKLEIEELLGSDAVFFCTVYGVEDDGNWEQVNILNRIVNPELLDPDDEEKLTNLRQVLFESRESRIRPGLDDKILADWNGLMIASLGYLGQLFNNPVWINMAETAFSFISSHMTDDNDRLFHSFRNGKARHTGVLDDYANMSRAALFLFEATGSPIYLRKAERWIEILNEYYWDSREGGYFYTASDAEALIIRTRNAIDNATPSGNGVMLEVLAKLHYLTGGRDYFEKATDIVKAFSAELGRNFFPLATLLNSYETLIDARQIIVIGRREEADVADYINIINDYSCARNILNVIEDSSTLPFDHPANGKGRKQGKATVYICTGPNCSLPANSAKEVIELLEGKK